MQFDALTAAITFFKHTCTGPVATFIAWLKLMMMRAGFVSKIARLR